MHDTQLSSYAQITYKLSLVHMIVADFVETSIIRI